jgi:hypothetical protein
VYAEERGFWTAEGGWATQFQHRPLPPIPAFEAGCFAIKKDFRRATQELDIARASAVQDVAQDVALVTEKLRAATAELR